MNEENSNTEIKSPQRRIIRVSETIMDKEMFYALISNFDGDVYMHGVRFADALRERVG